MSREVGAARCGEARAAPAQIRPWKKANKNNLIDKNTLKSIEDKKAPYYGNNYPFRFHSNTEYINLIKGAGFQVKFNEILIRSYNQRKITSEFIIIEAQKI